VQWRTCSSPCRCSRSASSVGDTVPVRSAAWHGGAGVAVALRVATLRNPLAVSDSSHGAWLRCYAIAGIWLSSHRTAASTKFLADAGVETGGTARQQKCDRRTAVGRTAGQQVDGRARFPAGNQVCTPQLVCGGADKRGVLGWNSHGGGFLSEIPVRNRARKCGLFTWTACKARPGGPGAGSEAENG